MKIKFKGTAEDMTQPFTDFSTLIAALNKLDLYYDTTPVTFNTIIFGAVQWFVDASSNPIPLTFKSVGVWIGFNSQDISKLTIKMLFTTAESSNMRNEFILTNPNAAVALPNYGFIVETYLTTEAIPPNSTIDLTQISKVFPIYPIFALDTDCISPPMIICDEPKFDNCIRKFKDDPKYYVSIYCDFAYNLPCQTSSGLPWWIWLILGLVIVVIIIGIFIVVKKNKKGGKFYPLLANRSSPIYK